MAVKVLKNQMINNHKMLIRLAALLFVLVLLVQPALADGDSGAGKDLAYTCLGCHGIDGYRNAYPSYRVPKLGGQKAAYLVVALKGYRDGNRSHPTMEAQASSLTDQEIEDVAAYLASIAAETVAAGGSGETNLDAAKPCTACHGQTGISVNALWPTLAGQHEDYLVESLEHYRDGSRSEPVMAAQAALIAEEDVELLARYFASLDGLETTEVD